MKKPKLHKYRLHLSDGAKIYVTLEIDLFGVRQWMADKMIMSDDKIGVIINFGHVVYLEEVDLE